MRRAVSLRFGSFLGRRFSSKSFTRQSNTVSMRSTSPNSELRDFVKEKVELHGSCACGSTGFVASGPSTLNFICHCAACRAHSKSSFVRASAFLPRQVRLVNPNGMTKTPCAPSGSPGGPPSNRLHCATCGRYELFSLFFFFFLKKKKIAAIWQMILLTPWESSNCLFLLLKLMHPSTEELESIQFICRIITFFMASVSVMLQTLCPSGQAFQKAKSK
jgi:hypothetical protein